MATIPTTEARAMFTKMLIDVYRERPKVMSFLRSFFSSVESATKYVSIEVQRGFEKVASDVQRGTEGNRNTFSRSTEKIYEPPYFREYLDVTELDLYDRLFGSTAIDAGVFTQFMQGVAEKMSLLVDKIERAYELQCSQVLESGIVTMKNGDNIDFKRKAGSLVDNSATSWSGSNDPFVQLEAGCTFLRQTGKAQGGTVNAILGSSALAAFLTNTAVTNRGALKNLPLDSVRPPQRDSVGASLHGQVSAGSYLVNLWSYPEFYDNASNTSTPYINPKKVIMLPENPRFKLAFAAVPQLIDEDNPTVKKGAYIFGDYKDKRNSAHIYDVKSAGIAVPVAVDQIYTMQVVA